MAYGSNWGTWYPYNNVYKKDGVIVRPYAIPTEEGYDYKIGIESNAVGQMTMVSAKFKHPEAVIKILNLYDRPSITQRKKTISNTGRMSSIGSRRYTSTNRVRFSQPIC